jgi:CheY-like chemotaxis protein
MARAQGDAYLHRVKMRTTTPASPDVLDVLTMLLRIEGVDVAGTGSGHEALTVFRSRHFDVVLG